MHVEVEPSPEEPGEASCLPAPSSPRPGRSGLELPPQLAAPPARLRAARAAYEMARDERCASAAGYASPGAAQGDHARQAPAGGHRGGWLPHRRPGGGRRGGQASADTWGRTPDGDSGHCRGPAALQRDDAERRLRFDPDARPPMQTRLLAELYAYGVARQAVSPDHENLGDVAAALDGVLAEARSSGQPPEDVLLRPP